MIFLRFLPILLIITIACEQALAFTGDENIKDDSLVTINSIILKGNKITKDKIILRELEFEKGTKLKSSVLDSLILESRQNLLNRSLFNFVTITKKLSIIGAI